MENQNENLLNSVPRAPESLTAPKTNKKNRRWAKKMAKFAKKNANNIMLATTVIFIALLVYMLFTGYDVQMRQLEANTAKWHKLELRQTELQNESNEIRAWLQDKGFEVFQ